MEKVKFKVGDYVRRKHRADAGFVAYKLAEITSDGWGRREVGSSLCSYYISSLVRSCRLEATLLNPK